MKTNKIKSISADLGFGIIIGFVNSIFGSGGGMIAVPLLTKKGFEQKDAHRNAIAVLLPVSVISAALYISKSVISLSDVYPYLLSGSVGAIAGTLIMSKISPKMLKGIFGAFIVYAGIRLLIR
ncbi:MAG: sulfite exporter TauE/SafE family protein [Clostridia bacterium]|nr:sulfite exporter TauE/SafE family protein [Clostridia bacterium]